MVILFWILLWWLSGVTIPMALNWWVGEDLKVEDVFILTTYGGLQGPISGLVVLAAILNKKVDKQKVILKGRKKDVN